MKAVLINPSLSRLKLPRPKPKPLPFFHPTAATFLTVRHRRHGGVLSFAFQDQFPQSSPPTQPKEERELKKEEEDYGEVSRIVGSRTVRFPVYGDDGSVSTTTTTEYLIEWKDGPQPLLGPSPAAIAADVEAEYETPWWTAARKADTAALSALLADESAARDPDAEDTDGRTALHLAAGLESEECIRMLAAAGADRREADAAARGGRVRAGGGCAGAAGGRGGRRGGGRGGKDGAGAGEGGAGGDAGGGIGEAGWAGGDGGGGGAGEGGGGEEEGVLGGVEGRREGVGEGGVGGRLRGRAGVRGGRRGGETEGSGGGRWEGVLGEVGGY